MRDDSEWLVRRPRRLERGDDRGEIVAIDLAAGPAEGFPFFPQRLHGHDLVAATGGLPLVEIDQRDEISQAQSWREHRAFPHGALLTFAIAHEHKYGIRPCLDAARERH